MATILTVSALALVNLEARETIYSSGNTRHYQVEQQDITEIVFAVYERYLALISNGVMNAPAAVTAYINNSGGYAPTTDAATNIWHLNRGLMVTSDACIKALIPNYAASGTETNFIQNLTVTGVWAQTPIGDGTNKFTRTPALGTNPPTYGEWPWQIYETNLIERYQAAWTCQYSIIPSTTLSNIDYYRGCGTGVIWQDAYAAACDDWQQVTPVPSATFEQSCEMTWYSNYYPNYQGGTTHFDEEIPPWCPGYGYNANVSLVGAEWVPTGITVSVVFSYLEPGASTTNLRVTLPDPAAVPPNSAPPSGPVGIYYKHDYGGGTSYWQSAGGYYLFKEELSGGYWVIDQTLNWGVSLSEVDASDGTGADPFGWYIWPGETPNPDRYYVANYIDFATNTPGPDCSGVFLESGTLNGMTRFSGTNGFYMYYTNSHYVIYNSLALNTNDYYWLGGDAPNGFYEAQNFYSEAGAYVSTEGHPALPDCSGTYDGGESATGPFILGDWTLSGADEDWSITNSGNTANWTGAALEGDYDPTSDSGAYGTATVAVARKTGTWTEPDNPGAVLEWGTNTVFYTCEFKKFKCEFVLSPATNLLHTFGTFFVYPTKVGSKFENQQIDWLIETNWCGVLIGGASQTNSPEKYELGDPLDEFPLESDDPTGGTVLSNGVKNTTKSGFSVNPTGKGIFGWQFNYCTNKFW